MFNLDQLQGTGAVEGSAIAELSKALEMGYGTDSATLTGGGALRVQSLDTTMQATIAENKHFTLFNKLDKPRIGATVDEWTEQSDVGGVLGASTNTETGIIPESTGQYDRRVGMAKYLSTRRQISLVASITNNMVDAEAVEQRAGAIQLMRDANYLSYCGDSTVVPTEFDGIRAQLRAAVAAGRVDPDHIIDMAGQPLQNIEPFTRAAAAVAGYGSFGTPTDLFWPNLLQADIDAGLDPAFRVGLEGSFDSVKLGAPVSAIRLSQGVVRCNTDVFIPSERLLAPLQAQPGGGAIAASLDGLKPASVTPGAPTGDVSSAFTSAHAGNYFYGVTGVNARGESTVLASAQVAMAAGQRVTLTIAKSTAGEETGYAIYRSKRNGTNTPADMRLVARIPRTGASTTFTDLNRLIPGTSSAYMLNMSKGDTAITWRQLLPMFKFQLFPTNAPVMPWAQLLFGYLRISKLRHHAIFDNVLPNGATWKPF